MCDSCPVAMFKLTPGARSCGVYSSLLNVRLHSNVSICFISFIDFMLLADKCASGSYNDIPAQVCHGCDDVIRVDCDRI